MQMLRLEWAARRQLKCGGRSILAKTTKTGVDLGALADLAIILAVLIVVKQSLLPISTLYAGPASTFSAMFVATLLLRLRGISWRDLGLRWPENWLRTIGLTVLTFVLFIAAAAIFSIIADRFFEDVGASGRFDHVEGDVVSYVIVMALVWTHGSFFEELLFRAFIISKASRLLGGGILADLIAVGFSSVFFGYRHYYYQGLNGALVTGGIGLTFGLLYLWFGRRNVLPLIFTHGIANSLAQTLRFLGIED